MTRNQKLTVGIFGAVGSSIGILFFVGGLTVIAYFMGCGGDEDTSEAVALNDVSATEAPAESNQSAPPAAPAVPIDPQIHVDELNTKALAPLRPYYAAATLFEGIDTSGWPQLPRDIGPTIVKVTLYELDASGAEVSSEQEIPIYLQNWSNVFAAYVATGMPVTVPNQMGFLPECEQLPSILTAAVNDPDVVFAVVTAIRNANPEVLTAIGITPDTMATEVNSHLNAMKPNWRTLEYEVAMYGLNHPDDADGWPSANANPQDVRRRQYLNRYIDAGRGQSGDDQIAQYRWALASLAVKLWMGATKDLVNRANFELQLMDPAFPHRDDMLRTLADDWRSLNPES